MQNKMKKILLIGLLMSSLIAVAETTTDKVTLSTATLEPGGEEVKITLSLEGSRRYTGYNIDIVLPEGIELNYYKGNPDVTMLKKGGIYPCEVDEREGTETYSHTLEASYGVAGDKVIRIACISLANESFIAESGNLATLYLKATAYAKPGVAEIKITNTDFGTYDPVAGKTTPYHFEDAISTSITIANTSKIPLAISSTNKWSTCVLPFDAEVPDGVKAYACEKVTSDLAYLTEKKSMEAYTPYILYSENGFNKYLGGIVDPKKYVTIASEGYLHGAIVRQKVTTGYVLQNKGDGAKFYNMNGSEFSIPEGKCWLEIPAEAKETLGIVFEDPMGIETNKVTNASTEIYDLNGNKVSKTISGRIYIINGQKVLILK